MDDDIAIDLGQFLEKIDPSLSSSLFGMRHYELEILNRGKWSRERRKYHGLQVTREEKVKNTYKEEQKHIFTNFIDSVLLDL